MTYIAYATAYECDLAIASLRFRHPVASLCSDTYALTGRTGRCRALVAPWPSAGARQRRGSHTLPLGASYPVGAAPGLSTARVCRHDERLRAGHRRRDKRSSGTGRQHDHMLLIFERPGPSHSTSNVLYSTLNVLKTTFSEEACAKPMSNQQDRRDVSAAAARLHHIFSHRSTAELCQSYGERADEYDKDLVEGPHIESFLIRRALSVSPSPPEH